MPAKEYLIHCTFIAVHFSELTKENKTVGFSHIENVAKAINCLIASQLTKVNCNGHKNTIQKEKSLLTFLKSL
jgi:hypothetical protein